MEACPQGSYLGPLMFLVLINDLSAGCLLHKFVDDTTLSEIIPNAETSSSMSSLVEGVLNWSQCNLMNINWCKTKELVLGCNSAKNFCRELCVDGNVVQRVNVYKLLRVTIDNTLKWKCAKASSRLYFLKILKRCSLSTGALIYSAFMLLLFARSLNMRAPLGITV